MSSVPQSPPSSADPVADAFRRAMVDSLGTPPKPPNAVVELLTEHFNGAEPEALPTVTDSYTTHLHLNFQLALDEFLAAPGRTHRIVGVHCPSVEPDWGVEGGSTSLGLLLIEPSFAWAPAVIGPPDYAIVDSSCDETKACLKQGLVMFNDAAGPGVIWVRGRLHNRVIIDVMHPSREYATQMLADLRERGVALSPYRGQIVELGFDNMYAPRMEFLPRPEHTDANEVILPAGLLEEIEEHSIDVVRAREALTSSGRHLKRGLLLHGRPGTGKTHTIRYLISQLPNTTVVIMSGARMAEGPPGLQPLNLIHDVIDVIVPGVIVLDDIDFIAEDRSMPGKVVKTGDGATREDLFALLELLDGIGEDSDLLFILTTNRPNTIEPAIAARPGRVDQAIEVPLPDADCRRRLVALYTRRLTLEAGDAEVDEFVRRTDGVTASFVREAVRRAAAVAALARGEDEKGQLVVTGTQLLAALDQLLDPEHPLTPVLLGAEPEHALPTLAQITATPDAPDVPDTADAES